eukprot:3611598-Pleurochrysis_carterae.AAC.2
MVVYLTHYPRAYIEASSALFVVDHAAFSLCKRLAVPQLPLCRLPSASSPAFSLRPRAQRVCTAARANATATRCAALAASALSRTCPLRASPRLRAYASRVQSRGCARQSWRWATWRACSK